MRVQSLKFKFNLKRYFVWLFFNIFALIIVILISSCDVRDSKKSESKFKSEEIVIPEDVVQFSYKELKIRGSNLDLGVIDEFLKSNGLPDGFRISLVESEEEGKQRIDMIEQILKDGKVQDDVVKFFLYNTIVDIYLRLSLYNKNPEYFFSAEKYAKFVLDTYKDNERFKNYLFGVLDNLAYVYGHTGRFDDALKIWEDLIGEYSDIFENADYKNWFGVQCVLSAFDIAERICGDNLNDEIYKKVVSFLEKTASLRSDEVGLFANMMLYKYYFKIGDKSLANEKFNIIEAKLKEYDSLEIHRFWQALVDNLKRWERWKESQRR